MSGHYSLQDEATLVDQLNRLLHSLDLPLSLISPTDLTPRLLIAVLESLLGTRLPMIARSAGDARTTRVQNMKIFLGVLEMDILQRDVGLSNVDPRRLADGEDEEVYYVAEVLAEISKDRELARARSIPLPRTPSPVQRPAKSQLDLDAESLFQTATSTAQPTLFSAFAHEESTMTSLFSDHHEDEYGRASDDGLYSDSDTGVSDVLGGLPPAPLPCTPPRRHQPLLFSGVNNPPIPREQAFSAYHVEDEDLTIRSPVRYDGYIEPVDEEQEIASFELSRSISSQDIPAKKRPESVKAQYTRTLELLTERARLLTQLSDIKKTDHTSGRGPGLGHG